MHDLDAIANRNQERALAIIRETGIIDLWKSHGAEPHLVGSLKTGLLMNHKDIDFHIYSDPFVLSESFAAMAGLAENPRIRRIEYANLLDTNEKCLEWHAWYLDQDHDLWQIDLIHMLKESPFAGYFENVADRILEVLTPETRLAILSIKNDLPPEQKTAGILIYQAVIRDGVRNLAEFKNWAAENNSPDGIVDWMP